MSKHTVEIEFDNEEAAKLFKDWMSCSGEQHFVNWFEGAKDDIKEFVGKWITFSYHHGKGDTSMPGPRRRSLCPAVPFLEAVC